MSTLPRNLVPANVDHGEAESVKTEYWVERLRRLGPAESLRVADELLRHARALRPDWPDRQQREADLLMHVRVGEALRRVHRRVG